MRLRVVTDSSLNVPEEWLRRLNIIEAPAVVNFEQESFVKRELTQPEFYRRLDAAPRPPTTAQPTPQQFGLAYQQAADEPYANVIESMTFDLGVILAALGGPGLLGAAVYSPEE